MFRWEDISQWMYLVVPATMLIVFGIWLTQNKKDRQVLGNSKTLNKIIFGKRGIGSIVQMLLVVFAALLMVIALVNPQLGGRKVKAEVKNNDIFILLDISTSMLAEDIKPSRLEKGKKLAQNLIEKLKGNRFSVILYAGTAFVHTPLTVDYAAASIAVSAAHPDMAATQGTELKDALETLSRSGEELTKKYVVLISDGEMHSENYSTALKELKNLQIPVFTVGTGDESGSFIPLQSRNGKYYKLDKEGKRVKTFLDRSALEEISINTGGSYYNVSEENALINQLRQLTGKESSEVEETYIFTDYASYFQWLLFPALILLFIDWIMRRRI